MSTADPFDEEKHLSSKKLFRNGTWMCEDVFKEFIKAGTTVVPGKTEREYTFCTPFFETTTANVEIYRSEKPNPKYVTDDGCHQIGEISITLSSRPRDCRQMISVLMQFGDTELHVTAKEQDTDNSVSAKFNFLK